MRTLAQQAGAAAVLWNRCYDSGSIRRDTALKRTLVGDGRGAESFNAGLLLEPSAMQTGTGGFFKVFTPFWRALRARPAPELPEPAPGAVTAPPRWPDSDALEDWNLLPRQPDWAGGLRASWRPGEAGAQARLADFIAEGLDHYAADRDRPARPHTSRLSPHLHWGEIGPRQTWHAIAHAAAATPALQPQARPICASWVGASSTITCCSTCRSLPRPRSAPRSRGFPGDHARHSWRLGSTGEPAIRSSMPGMRELWYSGWMHNRVRMIAASFLVKDLLLPWRDGEAWFWDTLVDADHANNPANWQWVAGCGTDAAPYFRVFNPVLQGEKFDPEGGYVRRWIPELAGLPDAFIHQPWQAPADMLDRAGVRLGETYPAPIVDHKAARARALAAFARIKHGAA